MNQRKSLKRAYKNIRSELLLVLYEEDPAEMGAAIGAPYDEYGPEVDALLGELTRTPTKAAVQALLEATFPT